jgi:hypothetical protein
LLASGPPDQGSFGHALHMHLPVDLTTLLSPDDLLSMG